MDRLIKLFLIGMAVVAVVFFFVEMAQQAAREPDPEPTATRAAEEPEPSPSFALANDAQVERIASGLCCGVTIRRAWTARSKAHQRAYFVAAEIEGPGVERDVAVWMHLGTPDDIGLTMSVEPTADVFSDWPYGPDTMAEASVYDPPGEALVEYVRSQMR